MGLFSPGRLNGMPKSADMEMELGEKTYPVRLRKFRQSKSISVSADTVKGEIRLNMPTYASTAQALCFAQSKADWLAARFAEALPAVPVINGAEIAFAGEAYRIKWSPGFPRKPKCIDGEIQIGGPEEHIQNRIISWMKTEARTTYQNDLEFYCEQAGLDTPILSVGDARRRWGSCSGRKAIRLNWRLIMAPPLVRRSVVAHEVAHLRHMDHSPRFYALLDTIFEGRRREADRWLKQHGAALHLIGA